MDETMKKTSHEQGFFAEFVKEYRKNKGAVFGLIVLAIIIVTGIISMFVIDYDTQIAKIHIQEALQGPSAAHFFGTDQYGRDIFCRDLYGTHYSLLIGICAVMVSVSIGSVLGVIAGYFGGMTETIIMRVMDVISPIPSVLLAICIASAFGQSLVSLMLAVGTVTVPAFARTARASVMMVRDEEYIDAARSQGASHFHIITQHIIPNSLAPIIVQATMRVASAIIVASSLSFLGLGIPAPKPEWGGMLSEGRNFIGTNAYMTIFPGLAIMITVLSINLIGDGIRDAMDPRLKR